jgi:hypothetical protein
MRSPLAAANNVYRLSLMLRRFSAAVATRRLHSRTGQAPSVAHINMISAQVMRTPRNLVSEFPVTRVKRRKRRNGFRQSGADLKPVTPLSPPPRDTSIRHKPTHPSPSARQFRLLLNGLAASALRRMFCHDGAWTARAQAYRSRETGEMSHRVDGATNCFS